jgi:hypothetical protein
MATNTCPYLGRVGDPDTFYLEPHPSHRCQALQPAATIELDRQARRCFGSFSGCSRFIPLAEGGARSAPTLVEPATPAVVAATRAPEPDGGVEEQVRAVVVKARERAAQLSFEEWLVYGAAAAIVVVVAWAFTFGRGASGPRRPAEPGVLARAQELLATGTPTAPPQPTRTVGPTRNAPPPATVPPRTPPAGGLIAALTPTERGAASFNARDKLADTGGRQLLVGNLAGVEYAGGLLFPLTRIVPNSRLDFAALELMGWEDTDLAEGGEWTVELLPLDEAEFANLTYETLVEMPAAGAPAWRIPASELSVSKANVLEFDAAQLEFLRARLPEGALAVRLRGPNLGDPESLFVWDSGFGEGFGIRPALRVGFVPPPVTPRPGRVQGEPTEEALLIPVIDPTPAPSPTPLPGLLADAFAGRILFLSSRTGRSLLYLMDPDSRELWRVTQSWPFLVAKARDGAGPGVTAVSANRPCGGARPVDEQGKPIPGAKSDPARTCSQILVSRDGGPQLEITEPGWTHYDPAVSPDGQWIAYVSDVTGNDEIFKIRVDGTENTRLTENVWEWDKHPSWSPDGQRIAFWSNRDGRAQIYVMNADGSNPINLSANSFEDADPVWVK